MKSGKQEMKKMVGIRHGSSSDLFHVFLPSCFPVENRSNLKK